MNEPLFVALNYVLSEILIQSKDIASCQRQEASLIVSSALMRRLLLTVHPAATNDTFPAVSAEGSLLKLPHVAHTFRHVCRTFHAFLNVS
jgi:hypothetical protein